MTGLFAAWSARPAKPISKLAWPVCLHDGYTDFLCSLRQAASSEELLRVGDFISLYQDPEWLYIAADGVCNKGDREATIEYQTVKNSGDGTPSL